MSEEPRNGDDQQPVAAVNVLDMDAVETDQQIAAVTRISGRARVSAPRSRVKHVEVLVKIRQLALLILGDLDPYPPNLTRRASPPPNVRRAAYGRVQVVDAAVLQPLGLILNPPAW